MEIRAHVDQAKMAASLKRAAKAFGDTTEQGVARFAVSAARAFAGRTQAFGSAAAKAKKAQADAIMFDMRQAVIPLKGVKKTKGSVSGITPEGRFMRWPRKRFLSSPSEIADWVDQRRTRRRGRMPKRLPKEEVATATQTAFNKEFKRRNARSGMAKGGWIGAGMKAASYQRGGDRIAIGKNFLSYAQKHARMGTARMQSNQSRMVPFIFLINHVRHVGDQSVFNTKKIKHELTWAAKNTLKWYKRAAKRALDKA